MHTVITFINFLCIPNFHMSYTILPLWHDEWHNLSFWKSDIRLRISKQIIKLGSKTNTMAMIRYWSENILSCYFKHNAISLNMFYYKILIRQLMHYLPKWWTHWYLLTKECHWISTAIRLKYNILFIIVNTVVVIAVIIINIIVASIC